MNPLFSLSPIPGRKVAGAAALGLIGLHGLGLVSAQQPGPAVANQPPATAGSQPSPAEDILEIREPYQLPVAFPWLACGAGTLATAGVGAGLWAFLRRRRVRPAYRIALDKLESARPLMVEGEGEAFSLAVSEIVRSFVEESIKVRAVHSTTDEFLRDLAEKVGSPLAPYRDELLGFLRHCDLAKFARWSLTTSQMEAMLASATSFVTAIGRPGSGVAPEKS